MPPRSRAKALGTRKQLRAIAQGALCLYLKRPQYEDELVEAIVGHLLRGVTEDELHQAAARYWLNRGGWEYDLRVVFDSDESFQKWLNTPVPPQQEAPSVRPLEFWDGCGLAGKDSDTPAHEVDLEKAIREAQIDAHGSLTRLDQWRRLGRLSQSTAQMRFDSLFTRYRVDREFWWHRDISPPKFVLLPDLMWDGALRRFVAAKLRIVCDLTEAAANVLAAHEMKVASPLLPSQEEFQAALEHLAEIAEETHARLIDLVSDVQNELWELHTAEREWCGDRTISFTPPERTPRESEDGEEEPSVEDLLEQRLSERAVAVLGAMLQMRALSHKQLKSRDEIAPIAVGKAIKPNSLRGVMADLVRRGWIRSGRGNKGGAWLTKNGAIAAKFLS